MRRKIPKGTNFDSMTESEIQKVEDWINNYPRKLFEGRTASYMFDIEIASLTA